MPALPPRPDLDQLRRRARELLRVAQGGDAGARGRFEALELPLTLAAAQLVVARDHGLASWEALKREVERRRGNNESVSPFLLRRVASLTEQDFVLDVLGAEDGKTALHADRRMAGLRATFPEQRPLRLAVWRDGHPVGGLLCVRSGTGGGVAVAVRAFCVVAGFRRLGIGRRLVETMVTEAMALGAGKVAEGGVDRDWRPVYERLGFMTQGSYASLALPLPGRARDLRARRLREAAGDVDAGVALNVDPATGKLPALIRNR